ncbi:SETMR methyltransferase, partial [Pseudoatta argentina]
IDVTSLRQSMLGRTAVFEWYKRFLEGRETLEDDKRSGRPILVRTPEMIEKVRDFVANDCNASLKMMEEALNIIRETIRTILHEDLDKTKVCAKFVPHTLRSDQKSARINYSRDIVAAAENNPNFLKSIVTGDKTWCFQYDPETKRNGSQKIHHKQKSTKSSIIPDLAPCDFSLFPKLKLKLKGRFFDDIPTIQSASTQALEAIPQTKL